jgi:hypothetical protein
VQRFLISVSIFILLLNLISKAENKNIITSFREDKKHSFTLHESENITNSYYDNQLLQGNTSTDFGLIFEKEFRFRWENNSYNDIIQLIGLNNKAQALQFRISVNSAQDDSLILIFQDIEKGTDVSDSSWVLDYNVFRGPLNNDSSCTYEVYVLLYNLNQNNGLLPGDYNHLIKVNYKVVDLPNIKDSIKSSMKISNALASTYQGYSIDITPSRDEFKIFARVPVVYPDYGIIFQRDTVYQLEDDSYIEIMQLKDLSDTLQALQFKLLVNKSLDDSTILTFQNIQKGSDIHDPSWVLDYNVIRGPFTANGGSVDEINVLLYNLHQNNGLPEGDYHELFKVKYRVANLPALHDSIKSSIKITEALGSTYQGYPINITPSRSEHIVFALNRIGLYGDVNGDGCLDVLDIIMIVDHIIGRDSLAVDAFERADISPWIIGNPVPYPDGFVNVLDLAVLQEIVLSGIYPSGSLIKDCNYIALPKLNGNPDGKVIFYINQDRITAYLDSRVDVVGAQIEFGNVSDDPNNMIIDTELGQGFYMKVNEMLKVLLYDRQGNKLLGVGENLLAEMPFNISRPEDIRIEKLILVDKNRHKLVEYEFEIILGNPPAIPLEYKLYQNYPNPFNPKTTIQYSISNGEHVILKVYDILGTEIEILVNEEKLPGKYELTWDSFSIGGQLPSGVYFYRMQAGNFVQTKKMILLK